MGVDLGAPLKTFLEDVASKKPTPGGGSVAALAGSLAGGLVSMVCRLTIGKEGYEDVHEEMEKWLEHSEMLRGQLEDLVVRDAKAYDAVSEAFRMDRSTPEAKERRKEAIQRSLRGAADAPLETARRSVDVLRATQDVAAKGNVNALSDAGTAAHLALACFHGARLNVLVNLASIKAPSYVEAAEQELRELEREASRLHSSVLVTMESRSK